MIYLNSIFGKYPGRLSDLFFCGKAHTNGNIWNQKNKSRDIKQLDLKIFWIPTLVNILEDSWTYFCLLERYILQWYISGIRRTISFTWTNWSLNIIISTLENFLEHFQTQYSSCYIFLKSAHYICVPALRINSVNSNGWKIMNSQIFLMD